MPSGIHAIGGVLHSKIILDWCDVLVLACSYTGIAGVQYNAYSKIIESSIACWGTIYRSYILALLYSRPCVLYERHAVGGLLHTHATIDRSYVIVLARIGKSNTTLAPKTVHTCLPSAYIYHFNILAHL